MLEKEWSGGQWVYYGKSMSNATQSQKPSHAPPKAERNENWARDLAVLMRTAARTEVQHAKSVEGHNLQLGLRSDGYDLAIIVTGVRLVQGDLDEAMAHLRNRRGKYNHIKNPETLTIQELKERQLPLYWNEQWLRAQLKRHGSYAAIAREHDYPSSSTIAAYAKRKFGISIQAQYAQKRQAAYRDHRTGKYTHQQLAEKYNIGIATIYRWLAQQPTQNPRTDAQENTPTHP